MGITLFIALQCFECSTMQVKQKKKSSNKWVCVICNQKQSVRKVFAQSYKAKELRFFVQSFNMSRKVVVDEQAQAVVDSYSEVDVEGENDNEVTDVRGKKRSDWSEYLDFDSADDDQRLPAEDDSEYVKMVTEMPDDRFKRPKLSKYSNVSDGSSSVTGGKKNDGNELFKPSFSRRSIKKPDFCTDGIMSRKDTEPKDLESERVIKPASKWGAYLIDDERVRQTPARFDGKEALKDDHVSEWDRAIMDINSEYQIVEDEVHPDFR